ncbi:MAG: UDP-N-acetylmuramoyl-tripeptide--D-alanyl-D-alanine ligase [Anaerolineae bacterium]|nr:MAG: UDP-N-acetylmuramoyl-tripeptide--D-alanyl-D-alanine ligase [Anaerolineae bacterium]
MLTLADLLEALTHLRPPQAANRLITDAVIDSRKAIPGSLFIAIPGERTDGHAYIHDAFARGASYALIEHEVADDLPVVDLRKPGWDAMGQALTPPYCLRVENTIQALQEVARFWRGKLRDVRVVGITGSVGKSTTKEVCAGVLSERYRTLKNEGNYNNEIGLPLTLLRLSEGHQCAVLEMGFYVPGEITFLCEIARPEIGVITNVGTVHAERAGSQEAIFEGKSELVQYLPPDGTAILNHDDPWVRQMAARTQARVLFYGLTPEADLWADHIEGLGLEGIRFRMHYQGETLYLRVPMIGRHSVHTALRAAATGLAQGLTWHEIVHGLRAGHAQLRLVATRTPRGALVLDDTYNASPASTLAALNLLDELEGRKIAVLGDMLELGPYEKQGHEMVGLRAAEIADILVTIGGRAHIIARAARHAGMPRRKIHECETNAQALDFLVPLLDAGDVVLVKGSRGMHMEEIVSGLEATA